MTTCAHGEKLRADDPVSLFAAEPPQYPALASAIGRTWRAVRDASQTLRRRWFEAAGLTDATKAVKRFSDGALDDAIEEFMRTMAGNDRSRAGFTSPDAEDGLVQQMGYLSHRVGVARAIELTGADAPRSSPLTDRVKERLNAQAFERLSKDGHLRFEGRLDEIKQGMLAGFERGDSPIAIARSLSDGLDGYERGRLLLITRTEIGEASERGARDEYRAQQVRELEVIGGGVDEMCAERIGNRYSIDDEENLPLFHPGCLCSTVPVLGDDA